MLKLKLQYFSHLMQRADLLEKNPDAGKYWSQEEKETTEDEKVRYITDSMNMNLGKLWEKMRDSEA